jgi:membrane protease YdiL (CAAX protease family)
MNEMQLSARARLGRFRRSLLKAAGISFVLIVGTSFGQFVPESIYAVMFGAATSVLIAVLIGLLAAWLWASTYRAERGDLARRISASWGYVTRATRWGLAAAGVGALLSSALPPRLLAEAVSDPNRIPVAAWVAIAFGGVGVAVGILEEWHSRLSEVESTADLP